MRPHIQLLPLEKRVSRQGLQIEHVALDKILDLNFSPVYVTSLTAVAERARAYVTCLKKHFAESQIYYAMKANFAEPILKTVLSEGCGIDIVSYGEWKLAKNVGCDPQKICFAGVGKKEGEWQDAISQGLGTLNVEHIQELNNALHFLNRTGASTQLALRLNPCVESKTHPHLKTGALDSKFGVLFEHLRDFVRATQSKFSSQENFKDFMLPLRGIHVHVGSQIENPEIIESVAEKVMDCCQFLLNCGVRITHLDFGGGLHVGFHGVQQSNADIEHHVNVIAGAINKYANKYPHPFKVSLEPGRSIVASSTVYLTQVLFTKENSPQHRFCYVDAGMNDFPRPALYGAKHEVALASAAKTVDSETLEYTIVGPVCESADVLAKNVLLPRVTTGDVLAFFEAGAYCWSMASHYNLRDIPAQVFVRDNTFTVQPPN